MSVKSISPSVSLIGGKFTAYCLVQHKQMTLTVKQWPPVVDAATKTIQSIQSAETPGSASRFTLTVVVYSRFEFFSPRFGEKQNTKSKHWLLSSSSSFSSANETPSHPLDRITDQQNDSTDIFIFCFTLTNIVEQTPEISKTQLTASSSAWMVNELWTHGTLLSFNGRSKPWASHPHMTSPHENSHSLDSLTPKQCTFDSYSPSRRRRFCFLLRQNFQSTTTRERFSHTEIRKILLQRRRRRRSISSVWIGIFLPFDCNLKWQEWKGIFEKRCHPSSCLWIYTMSTFSDRAKSIPFIDDFQPWNHTNHIKASCWSAKHSRKPWPSLYAINVIVYCDDFYCIFTSLSSVAVDNFVFSRHKMSPTGDQRPHQTDYQFHVLEATEKRVFTKLFW